MDIDYGENEIAIVKTGIVKIKEVLMNQDINAKGRLLFYLDWYLDPYYQNDLSNIMDGITDVLQELIISSDEEEIIGEAIHLLSSYLSGPYEILERHVKDIPEKFRADVLYLINRQN
jgi:hypothetical protein